MPDRAGALAAAARVDDCGPAQARAFAAAHAAMAAGCRFLIARAEQPVGVPAIRQPHRGVAMRRAGNCLRELDRMLSVLIDASGHGDGAPPRLPGVYAREGDAAHKLHRIAALRHHFAHDAPRLRAIGRLRAMACGDMAVEAASRPQVDLAVATRGLAHAGDTAVNAMVIGDAALGAIAEFYLMLADRMQSVCAGTPRGAAAIAD